MSRAAPGGAGMVTRRGLLAVLFVAALLRAGVPLAQENALEYAVKATYIYKFAPFVQWPESASAAAASFDICIVGRDPFGPVLDEAVHGEQVRGRPIFVRRLSEISRSHGCQVVFAGGSATQSVPDILRSVNGQSVLTVTDSALSPEAKGIVHFVIHDDRVRFEIDDRAAADNGLMISSKVLSLALSVTPRT